MRTKGSQRASVAPDTQKLSPQRQSEYWMPCCAWKAVIPLEPYTDTCAILVALDRTANCHIISCAPTYRLPGYTAPPGGQGRSNTSSCFAKALPGEMLTGWTGQRTPGGLLCSASRPHLRLTAGCWRALISKGHFRSCSQPCLLVKGVWVGSRIGQTEHSFTANSSTGEPQSSGLCILAIKMGILTLPS